MRLREVAAAGATIAVRESGDPTGTPSLFRHALGRGAHGASPAIATEPLAAGGFG